MKGRASSNRTRRTTSPSPKPAPLDLAHATPPTNAASETPRKSRSEYYDPCQEAASKSIKCLHRNGGDKTMCGDYFQ